MELILLGAVLLTAFGLGYYRLSKDLAGATAAVINLQQERERMTAAITALEERVAGWERHLPNPDPRRAVWRSPPELDRRAEELAPLTIERVSPPARLARFLNTLEQPDEAAAAYFDQHRHRTLVTLAMLPPGPGRALELGSYGVMAAALERALGYTEVETANFGALGTQKTDVVRINGAAPFVMNSRLFNAERDPFPYPDESFDLVLLCEIIEHFSADPLHCLRECRRILRRGGKLMVTTPNIASCLAVARTLQGRENPQLYSTYARNGEDPPHVREYTPGELAEALRAAGLTVTAVHTEGVEGWNTGADWVEPLLDRLAFPRLLRGELLFCLAERGEATPGERYPAFLYDS